MIYRFIIKVKGIVWCHLEKKMQNTKKKLLNNLLKDSECKKIADDFDAEMKFRRELYKARKDQAISQKQLSELTGLSQQMISRIETGWKVVKNEEWFIYTFCFPLRINK